MIYLKYKFNNKEQAEAKILEQGGTNASFIKLNKFTSTEGTYDDEGNELTAPILSEGYAVDVLWRDLNASPDGWAAYEVNPTEPKHKLF
tara:strand:+ start:193 stop:459 length:267 start_codon:yes stop_codon:yes gene_type:complete